MSEIKVNKISPRTNCGTTTLGDSGDTFTIPSGVSITNQGTASGFGSTGEVSWVTTKKTTGFTVTSGEGYFCDTSSGGFTVTLPAGTAGNSFAVADYTNTFQTGNLVITPNGTNKIGGINASVTLSTEGQSAYFVYVDDTEGWKNVIDSTSNITGNAFISASGGTESTSGNCKIHTFTGPGTFTVSSVAACAANNVVSYLVVAGGGAGAGSGRCNTAGGGGGAGGFREVKSPATPYTASPLDGYPSAPNRITVTATAFPITVGGGGTGKSGYGGTPSGSKGSPSIFSTITSAGGGGGKSYASGTSNTCGGSGGGGGAYNSSPGEGSTTAGTGNTPPVSPAQGSNGGTGSPSSTCANSSGGGGGATAVGTNHNDPSGGGAGGTGATTSITGSPVARAGGGGGSGGNGRGAASPCGSGAQGANSNGCQTGCAAAANTGGGGGGTHVATSGGNSTGGNGGSGIVVIRYKISQLNGN